MIEPIFPQPHRLYPEVAYLMNLAYCAGNLTRDGFQLGMKVDWKEDDTPLTATDTAINEMVVEAINRDFPKVKVIGEEGSNLVTGAKYTVYCDPVDGTIPFKCGVPISAFCISVVEDQTPLAAVIYDPFEKRFWSATKGQGCYLSTQPDWADESPDPSYGPSLAYYPGVVCSVAKKVAVSKQATLKNAMLCMLWWKGAKHNLGAVCEEVMNRGAHWMNPVSIAYFGGLLASGDFDATIFPGTKIWETAAMQLIVEEAGGKVTDMVGNPIRYGGDVPFNGHVMSNGLIHEELLDIIHSQCVTNMMAEVIASK